MTFCLKKQCFFKSICFILNNANRGLVDSTVASQQDVLGSNPGYGFLYGAWMYFLGLGGSKDIQSGLLEYVCVCVCLV